MNNKHLWYLKERLTAVLILLVLVTSPSYAQYGTILTGAGAVNRSMAGVATATPLSPSGAMYWNPATLTGFSRSEMDMNAELLMLDTRLGSTILPNAFGPGFPNTTLSGVTRSNSTVFPVPNMGMVYRPEDNDRIAYGFALNGVAGFGVNYPSVTDNPVLSPVAPVGLGVGPVYGDYQVLQINPSIAYKIMDRLTIGGGPNIDVGHLQFDSAPFITPDDANRDGFPTYRSATHTSWVWGGGFTIGLYYKADDWSAGFSYKSPQWFEPYRYNTTDEIGNGRGGRFQLNLPMILSWGVSYTGFDRLTLATDVRFLNFSQAKGYGTNGYDATGAVTGVGYRDVFSVAVGAQYQLCDRVSLRGGYSYATNPVPNDLTFFNLASNAVISHIVSIGGTWAVNENFNINLGYLHGFDNAVSGPYVTPQGPIHGTSVRAQAGFNSIVIGMSMKFGG